MFSTFVCEQIGWYVYVLRDPRNGQVFYVGKGQGNRVFQHARDAIAFTDADAEKLERIRAIRADGRAVETFIVRHGIEAEKHAYDIEAAVIDAISLVLPTGLSNVVVGHGHHELGLAEASVGAILYDAPRAPDITHPSVLIRIPRRWTPRMTAEELYEATHGWWAVGPQRNRAQYAFAVNHGVVRAVYLINSWRPRREGDRDWQHDAGKKPRWGFDGSPASEMVAYLNTSVRHHFQQGMASPVIYLNCK